MACDLCGSKTKLYRAAIEGTEMNVCADCARFGRVLGELKKPAEFKKKQAPAAAPVLPEQVQVIVEGYSQVIKSARELAGLTQKDFAQRINEKESLVHKLETGEFEPNLALARKLERALRVRLVEQKELERLGISQEKSETFTIGDFIKVKKKPA